RVAPSSYTTHPYRSLGNGQTGKVTGSRPYSALKITLLILALVGIALLAFWLYTQFAQQAAARASGERDRFAMRGVAWDNNPHELYQHLPAILRDGSRPRPPGIPDVGSRHRAEGPTTRGSQPDRLSRTNPAHPDRSMFELSRFRQEKRWA